MGSVLRSISLNLIAFLKRRWLRKHLLPQFIKLRRQNDTNIFRIWSGDSQTKVTSLIMNTRGILVFLTVLLLCSEARNTRRFRGMKHVGKRQLPHQDIFKVFCFQNCLAGPNSFVYVQVEILPCLCLYRSKISMLTVAETQGHLILKWQYVAEERWGV